tara:strand:- start:377 stop:913 length:537 start_codon:yes stop_codon:yes gene_type:complete
MKRPRISAAAADHVRERRANPAHHPPAADSLGSEKRKVLGLIAGGFDNEMADFLADLDGRHQRPVINNANRHIAAGTALQRDLDSLADLHANRIGFAHEDFGPLVNDGTGVKQVINGKIRHRGAHHALGFTGAGAIGVHAVEDDDAALAIALGGRGQTIAGSLGMAGFQPVRAGKITQ